MTRDESLYLDGWRQGARYVERNRWWPRIVLNCARLLIKAQAGPTEYGRGWIDAILSGYGA